LLKEILVKPMMRGE